MADSRGSRPDQADGYGFGFLLVQLGFHVARTFKERLAPIGLEPRHVGMLTRLAANEGKSQQAIGELIGLNPTRMVFLVDELEQRGLVERRRNPASSGHDRQLGASLTGAQRKQLTALLRQLAEEQEISEDSLPGPPPGIP
jgi:DNA-binding MarR family transcriptional regulator